MRKREYGFDKEGNLHGPNYFFTKDCLTPTKEEAEAFKNLMDRFRKYKELKS